MSLSTQDSSPPESDRLLMDHELVVQARAGDPFAFEKLYERYNDRICLYMIHMVGNDEVGCELAQETFLRAWQALPGLRDESRFVGWLYRIATNIHMTISAATGSFAGFPGNGSRNGKAMRR